MTIEPENAPHVFLSGEVRVEATDGFLDIAGARQVELHISADGRVIWVHTEKNTKLRICQIEGGVRLSDLRPRNRRRPPKGSLAALKKAIAKLPKPSSRRI